MARLVGFRWDDLVEECQFYVHRVGHAVGLCWVILRPPGAWPKEYGETSIAFGERDEIDSKLQRSL